MYKYFCFCPAFSAKQIDQSKKERPRFVSNAILEKWTDQGSIAIKNAARVAIFLLKRCDAIKNTTTIIDIPERAEGNRTDISLSPNIATKGTAAYG